MTNKTSKLVLAALMAAMTCIATILVQVPSPTGGFIHLGDGLVLLSGILLGPVYGTAAAGIGSMFADIFLGYMGFAPATLLIKALAAVTGYFIFHLLTRLFKMHIVSLILSGIGGGIIITCGYFFFEAFILGLGIGAGAQGLLFNLVQNLFGIIVSALLFPLLTKVPGIREMIYANSQAA
ncbi:hypothetical protein acsn021_09900 [Anaerocolumna cellulosilytica]|uniref:Uncharacterized protein n=1 Tax=Anaerocolumna cellulosilytica TaxID=433286 RepID=A0A6S6R2L9_9FIRM|nr:ECF transporter S component [Anaerocolumna cellulosilytica]MBB5194476.1 putative membrane protein [Anaerocolumna cellulosilytica]BCJ93421.1 hypothetical protein acsn021_09900 [Anaerocolumna cellulosilytica]